MKDKLDILVRLCYNNKVIYRRSTLGTLLSVALEEEFPLANKPPEISGVVYTGVGKINATFNLTRRIIEDNHNLSGSVTEVINFGTVGSVNGKHTGLVEVDTILQRDMVATPLAPRGQTPYQGGVTHAIMLNSGTNITLGTGDSFVNTKDPWFDEAKVDIVDMEAYAMATVCAKLGIKFRCIKYVSDNADENADFDWVKSLQNAQNQFQKWFEQENNLKT